MANLNLRVNFGDNPIPGDMIEALNAQLEENAKKAAQQVNDEPRLNLADTETIRPAQVKPALAPIPEPEVTKQAPTPSAPTHRPTYGG